MEREKTLDLLIGYLLANLKIPYTKNAFRKVAMSSPDDISLSGITDALDIYQVPNLTARLKPQQLTTIDFPAVVQIVEKGEENLVVLHQCNEQSVTYYDVLEGIKEISFTQFIRQWTGITLIIASSDASAEPAYQQNFQKQSIKTKEQYLVWGILISIFFTSLLWINQWPSALLLVSSTIGLISSIVLLKNEMGASSKLISKLCNFSKSTDCQAVTNSTQSKLFGWLSWAEVGMLYFASFGLVLVLSIVKPGISVTSVLTILSLLTIPYVVFSLYYQGRVVKKWCTLCLIVQSVLLANVAILITTTNLHFQFQTTTLYVCLVAFGLPLSIWLGVRNSVLNPENLQTEINYLKFVRDRYVFKSYLTSQPKHYIHPLPNDLSLGNSAAPTKIVMVSNPFCKPCAQAHEQFNHLLNYYGEDVELIIRFIPSRHNALAEANTVIRHLMALKNEDSLGSALNDWYRLRNYEQWQKMYPVEQLPEVAALSPYMDWTTANEIDTTPTVFIDGHKLEQPYLVEHLAYHLRYIIELNSAVLA